MVLAPKSLTDTLIYLQDSLGGNSKTIIIANISPSSRYTDTLCLFDFHDFLPEIFIGLCISWSLAMHVFPLLFSCSLETLSTLKFAQRAKLIKNNVMK